MSGQIIFGATPGIALQQEFLSISAQIPEDQALRVRRAVKDLLYGPVQIGRSRQSLFS